MSRFFPASAKGSDEGILKSCLKIGEVILIYIYTTKIMPVPYVKKVVVKNAKHFEKYGIDPAKLSLAQRRYTDKFIDLLKPANRLPHMREDVAMQVIRFVELTEGKNKDQIKVIFRSLKDQLFSYDKNPTKPTIDQWNCYLDVIDVLRDWHEGKAAREAEKKKKKQEDNK